MNKRLITIREFCDTYGVRRSTAYSLINAKKIVRVKIGRAARITVESAEAWFDSLRDGDDAGDDDG